MIPSGPLPGLRESVSSAIDGAGALRLLAAGATLAEAAGRVRVARDASVTAPAAVREVVAHAAVLARDYPLRPPARVAFMERHAVDEGELEGIQAQCAAVAEGLLSGDPEVAHARPKPALHYGAFLLDQERFDRAVMAARREAPALDGSLTGTDRVRVDDFLLYASTKGALSTLSSLVDGWRRHARRLADPSGLLYEEYEDMLARRDRLEGVLSLVSPPARRALDQQVAPVDGAFIECTRELPVAHISRGQWSARSWWWFRIPHMPGELFVDYLRHFAPEAARFVTQPPDP